MLQSGWTRHLKTKKKGDLAHPDSYNINPSHSKPQYLHTLNKCHMTLESFSPCEYHFVKYLAGAMSSSRVLPFGHLAPPTRRPFGKGVEVVGRGSVLCVSALSTSVSTRPKLEQLHHHCRNCLPLDCTFLPCAYDLATCGHTKRKKRRLMTWPPSQGIQRAMYNDKYLS